MRFTLLSLVVLFLASCASEPAEKSLVIGKWKYDLDATKEGIDETALNEVEFKVMDNMLRQANNLYFNYKEDGTYEVIHRANAPIIGKWRMGETGNELIVSLYGRDELETIVEVSKDRLVLGERPSSNISFNRIFVPYTE